MAHGKNKFKKDDLVRKENKVSLSTKYYVNNGGEYRWNRSKMKDVECEVMFQPMKSQKLGRDFKPLFKFIQSKVGQPWDTVFSEIVQRTDEPERGIKKVVGWLVNPKTMNAIVRIGESTYYHAMFVDENGLLQFIDKSAKHIPGCNCCTYSLDGKVIKAK